MNILVTLDKNYLLPLTVLLKSISKSNPDGDFDIYVAHNSLTPENIDRIQKAAGVNMRLHPVIVPDYSVDDPMFKKRLTLASYYRLYAIDYLPKDIDRILYLDPDIVVINPLDEFYNMDMEGKLIAAAGHTYSCVETFNKIRLQLESGRRYINSGIILMDIAKMRQCYTINDICDFIVNYKNGLFRMLQGDQDICNTLFKNQIKIIDEKFYNLDEATLRRFKKTIDVDWVRKNSVIIHFNGKHKPWKAAYKGQLLDFYYDAYKR